MGNCTIRESNKFEFIEKIFPFNLPHIYPNNERTEHRLQHLQARRSCLPSAPSLRSSACRQCMHGLVRHHHEFKSDPSQSSQLAKPLKKRGHDFPTEQFGFMVCQHGLYMGHTTHPTIFVHRGDCVLPYGLNSSLTNIDGVSTVVLFDHITPSAWSVEYRVLRAGATRALSPATHPGIRFCSTTCCDTTTGRNTEGEAARPA